MKKLGLRSLLIAVLALSACVICSAQTGSLTTAASSLASPVVQDNETLKALEIANIRLKAAEEREKLLNERLAAKDEIIRAKEGTIAVRDEQIALLKSAGADRRAVDDLQRERLIDAKEQLAKADARIHRLEHPGFLRSLFDTRTAYGAIAGYGVCKAAGSNVFTR